MQGCQLYGVKRIKSYFPEWTELWKKVGGISLLLQVVVISLITPISSSISLNFVSLILAGFVVIRI